jgi:hypothetical protein
MRPLPILALAAACGRAPSAPAPAPVPSAAGGAPCFPDRSALDAAAVYAALDQYLPSYAADEPAKRGTYGTCTVADGQIRTADGALVGELGCGLRILVPRIRDDLGLELGALGEDVLAKKPAPVPALRCFANGADQARCSFDRAEGEDTDATAYVVGGSPGDGLSGDAAVAFFAPRPVVEIHFSVWCH